MKRCFTLCVLFMLAAILQKAGAQTAPLYNFSAKTLDSGTALNTGAVYRFSNVYTNVDAFVKVTGMSAGITLKDIDRTADGYGEAFQPEYRINGNTNAYIDFRVTFVVHNTSTPVVQPLVSATGLDIDGQTSGGTTLKEFNQIDMGNGVYEYNSFNSEIMISQIGSAFLASNYTGVLYGALVDTTAKEVMYTVTSSMVSTFTYRVGANNQTSGSSTRYASLYFKKFTYQHFPLAISSLVSFSGYAAGDKVTLNWELTPEGPKTLYLERSYPGGEFNTVAEYHLTASGNKERYSYTDDKPGSGMVFYRLRSVASGGKTEYSSVLSFKIGSASPNRMAVYPTLVSDHITVSIQATTAAPAILRVTDLNGRAVRQQQWLLKEGANSLEVDGFSRLSKGNYIVSVRTGSALMSRQVVIQ